MHDISVAAVALLLAMGCQGDKKKASPEADRPPDSASKPAPPAPKAGGLRVDQTPAPQVTLECDKLLLAEDLARICNVEAAWKKDPFESGTGPTSCSRRAGPGDSFVRLAVGVYPHTESARAVTRGAEPGSIKMERKRAGGASTAVAHTRKGNIAVSVSAVSMGKKEPACTDEQLGQLVQVVESRLP